MDPSNDTETEDETIALKKKRARRVSFADNEITSVHIFRRDDEDSESPLESTKPISSVEPKNLENDVLGFFRDLGGDSDEESLKESTPAPNASGDREDEEEGEAVNVRKSFLKPIGLPSPGSSTAGSVASTDDEDEFHGPVSASFIRPGQLSDSAASDDNHDLTMDSTAFSLHYRSLAWSDSGDLKTPTRFAIPFEEKTPSQTSGSIAPGSFMELTKVTKQPAQPSVPTDAASASRDSNDMSIVGKNPHRFDYDRLSPSIDAMLAEGSKDLPAVSEMGSIVSDLSKQSEASVTRLNRNGVRSSSDSAKGDTAKDNMSVTELLVAPGQLLEINRCSMSSPIISDLLLKKGDNTVGDVSINQMQTPDRSIKRIEEFVKDTIEPDKERLDFAGANRKTPSEKHGLGYHYSDEGQGKEYNTNTGQGSDIDHKSDQVYTNLTQGLTPSSVAGREQLLMGSPDLSRHTGAITPPSKLRSSILLEENVRNGKTLSSIRENISKLKSIGTSSSISSLREEIDRSKQKLSKYSPGSTLLNRKDGECKHVGTLNSPIEDQLFCLIPKDKGHQNLINMDDHGTESPRNFGKSSQNEDNRAGEPFHCITADIFDDGKNPKSVKTAVSPMQMLHLTNKMIDFDLADSTVGNVKDENAVFMHKICVSSPVELLNQKLSPLLDNQKNCSINLKQLDQQNESVNCDLVHSSECSSQTTTAKQMDMSYPENSENSSLAFEAQGVQLSKVIYMGKSVESPAKKVLVLSASREDIIRSPLQEASIVLPSMQEPPSDSLCHDMQNLSPKGNSDSLVDNHCNKSLQAQVAESPFAEFCEENWFGKKCKGIELLSEGNNVGEIGRIDSSSKVHDSYSQIIFGQSNDIRSEREKLGDQMWKNCVDILEKFSRSTKQLLFPSVDKLNLTMIGMLEDILVHLRRAKKYDMVCSEIHSEQKITEPLCILRHKRVVETRTLLYNITYEKAKLQLMCLKHERLQNKVQQLSSGLRESHMLKSKCTSHSSKVVSINTPAESHFHSGLIISKKKCQIRMQEHETLVSEAKSLSKFLHSCCKLEGDHSCADTITVVHDYLKKRMSYKCVFQNLKLWEIDNFQHKDGCYRVLLNYCDYIIQSIVVNNGSPTILVSNKLNDQNIVKIFPDMEALAAFVFVLNPDTAKRCNGSRCLAQETQITSSVLSNLLDVIEEIQLARIEIRNLVHAKFYPHSDGRLDLLLSFIDFNTGRKLKVIFDMTSLKCGAYPMDILPSHIYDVASGEQKALSVSLETDIRSSAERANVGYSRITRLCRCIARAVSACTPST